MPVLDTSETKEPSIDLPADLSIKPVVATPPSPTQSAAVDTPSRWRRAYRAIARHPQLTQIAIFLSLFSGASVVLLYLLFKGAWSAHQDNAAILSSILKMELSQEKSQTVDNNELRVVTRTFLTLEPHVEADGWTWINRFGSTITYGKQDQRLIASCSPYSPLYLVCDLNEIP